MTFSQTERAKYQASFPSPSTGRIFTDEFRDQFLEYLNGENQLIEHWILRAKRGNASQEPPYYNTSDGSLADVVKILLNENQLPTLLMLSHHPQIPLHHLLNLSWGHHFGYSRVAEAAMDAYIFFNFAAAANLLQGGEYLEIHGYARMLRNLLQSMDYPAQQIPHRVFFRWSDQSLPLVPIPMHEDINRLKEYIKDLFRLLYQLDVVLRECGVDPGWEGMITSAFCYDIFGGLKVDYYENTLRFV